VVEGFWLGHWMRQRSIPAALKLFHEIAVLIRAGVLATEIGESFALGSVAAAVRAAEVAGRHGKVLLKIAESA
jgi:NADPH:quinone reductase-like Zn-dependent oxidoreductase